MYGVQGRTWVALGDPVGPPDRLAGLVRLFLERCDDFGGVPVFYEVGKEGLHRYADFGLTFVKLGEEARVDLSSFSLEGARASKHRQALKRLEKEGGDLPRHPRRRGAGRDGPASSGLRRLAPREGRRREGVFAGLLRPRLRPALSGGRRRAPGTHPGLRQPVARRRQGRAVGGPDALPQGRAEGRHGSALRPPPALGPGAGLSLVRARDGAPLRLREIARRSAVDAAGRLPVPARGEALQLPGPARVQGEVQSRSGSPTTSPIPAGWRFHESWPTSRPSSRAATARSS